MQGGKNVFDQAVAFNQQFRLGDRLLVRDGHGFRIVRKLQKREFVLDEGVYIELEDYPDLLPIWRVVGKVVE